MDEDVIRFDTMPSVYWDLSTKISYLQRRIIVYSIMYYERDESCVSDAQYDGISRQLVRLMAEASPEELKRTRYYYAMYDFDGSTGFDVPHRLTPEDYDHCLRIAMYVLYQWHREASNNETVRKMVPKKRSGRNAKARS